MEIVWWSFSGRAYMNIRYVIVGHAWFLIVLPVAIWYYAWCDWRIEVVEKMVPSVKRGLSGHQFSSSFFYVSHTRISVPIKTFMGVRSPYKPTPDFHVNAPIFQDNHCATYMQNAKLYNTFPNRLFGYALLSSRFVMTGAMLLLDITSEEKIDTLKSDIWNARFMSMTAHLLVCLHACWKPGHHATSRMTSFFCKKKKNLWNVQRFPPIHYRNKTRASNETVYSWRPSPWLPLLYI